MKAILKSELNSTFDQKVAYSWRSPLIGSLIILPWGYFTFTWMKENLPSFIYIVNIVFWGLFMLILIKQIKQTLNSKKFLLATRDSYLILPFNHMIKTADADKDYYLEIDLTRDINQLSIVKETRHIPYQRAGKAGTEIKFSTYLEFELKDSIQDDILLVLKKVLSDDGFQGSPLLFRGNLLQFYIDGHSSSLKKIQKILTRFGIYNGKIIKRKFKLSDKTSREQALLEYQRLNSLGDTMTGGAFLKKIKSLGLINDQEYNKLFKNRIKAGRDLSLKNSSDKSDL